VASVPEAEFADFIAQTKAEGIELTTAGVLRMGQQNKRAQMREEKQAAPPLPNAKYRVFYADPPWQYNNAGVITESDAYGRAARHYPTLSIAELCEMGQAIKEMTEPDAVLFMWVTSPLLEECFAVINAWGFTYKTSYVWDKVGHNYGHYNSVRHELLLVCTHGSCTPDIPDLYDSVISIEKTRVHSQKPQEFRTMIDALYTWGRRVELFSRSQAYGWDVWGNEIDR
jgi:N6-adenosine-specific RNA methylase IME4